MRQGTQKFYYPVVFSDGEIKPLPAGRLINHLYAVAGSILNDQESELELSPKKSTFESKPEPTLVPSDSVLDPMCMPIVFDVYNQPQDGVDLTPTYLWRNQLRVDWSDGMYVSPLRSVTSGWVMGPELPNNPQEFYNDYNSEHLELTDENLQKLLRGKNASDPTYVVTLHDLIRAFKDCDDKPIKPFALSKDEARLVTCGILRREIERLRTTVDILLDQFKKPITQIFDASGATKDVQANAHDAGLDQSKDVLIPFEQGSTVIYPEGTSNDSESELAPSVRFDKAASGVVEGEVIAIDVFDTSNGKAYKGTYYRKAEGRGWDASSWADFVLQEAKVPRVRRKSLETMQLVVRKIRAGESAVNVKPMVFFFIGI